MSRREDCYVTDTIVFCGKSMASFMSGLGSSNLSLRHSGFICSSFNSLLLNARPLFDNVFRNVIVVQSIHPDNY